MINAVFGCWFSRVNYYNIISFNHVPNIYLKQVINYEMPPSVAGYVHRIGRTGRAYSTGASISLVSFLSNNIEVNCVGTIQIAIFLLGFIIISRNIYLFHLSMVLDSKLMFYIYFPLIVPI